MIKKKFEEKQADFLLVSVLIYYHHRISEETDKDEGIRISLEEIELQYKLRPFWNYPNKTLWTAKELRALENSVEFRIDKRAEQVSFGVLGDDAVQMGFELLDELSSLRRKAL